jgi:hypothetical protein
LRLGSTIVKESLKGAEGDLHSLGQTERMIQLIKNDDGDFMESFELKNVHAKDFEGFETPTSNRPRPSKDGELPEGLFE